MIRVMLDSDRLDIIQACNGLAPLLATYSDLVPNPDALQAKLNQSKLVLIDRKLGDPSGKASVCDIEPGLFTVDEFPAWLAAKEKAGITDPTAYVTRSELSALDQVTAAKTYFRWVATLDGTCTIGGYPSLRAPAAVQILPANQVGIHVDLSLVYEDQWNPTKQIVPAQLLPALMSITTALNDLHALTG